MTITQIWLNSYLHPRQAMDALAKLTNPRAGAIYTFIRALMLALLFYLPFYLLKFKPITPSILQIFDTPDYFLYAAIYYPIFALLSWIFLSGAVYVILRLSGYQANFDQVLNLGGLLELTIGIVIWIFDWLTVLVGLHTNAVFTGVAHIIISDPWSIALTAIFYKKYFAVPVWLSVLLGIIVRILYLPLAIVFLRT